MTPARKRLRVIRDGPHSRIESSLCGACPLGPTGCCATPPAVAWADLGRIASLGGADWLALELAAGRLHPCSRGLGIARIPNPDAAATGLAAKCVYHGPGGCTLSHERRSATCSYYVCEEALADAGDPAAGRAALGRLTARYAAWDDALEAEVRAAHPAGPPWDAAFFAWLGEAFAARTRRRPR